MHAHTCTHTLSYSPLLITSYLYRMCMLFGLTWGFFNNELSDFLFGRFLFHPVSHFNCFLASVMLIELVHTLDSLYFYFKLTIVFFLNCDKFLFIMECMKIKKTLDVQWRGTIATMRTIYARPVEKRIDLMDGVRCIW